MSRKRASKVAPLALPAARHLIVLRSFARKSCLKADALLARYQSPHRQSQGGG